MRESDSQNKANSYFRLVVGVCGFLLLMFAVRAERLPIRIYTSADGLGSSFVSYLMRDSHGFLWFCTRDGLSRFDGSREVDAKSPLRSAIEAQLAGATAEENSRLLHSPVSGINLISVRVKNKTAYASFTRTDTTEFDKTDALRFRNSVRQTALQFPSVRRIEICLDGVSDFWRVGEKGKRKKCQ